MSSSLGGWFVGWVSLEAGNSGAHLFADADLGGWTLTQCSKIVVMVGLMGVVVRFPVIVVSGRQSCVADVPPEVAVVSGHYHCVFRELVLAFGHVRFHVLPRDYVVALHEDTQAMITVVRVPRDPTLRYVRAQDPQERHGICARSVCRCDRDQQTRNTRNRPDLL